MNRKIWLAISIGIVVIFLWSLPISATVPASFAYSLIGAALLFISLTQLFGQFSSLKDLFKKPDKNKKEPLGKFLAPFMVLPSIVFLFVCFFYSGTKKNNALETDGHLVKGVVLNGESLEKTALQTKTSFELKVQFIDSLGIKHSFEQTVLQEDFNYIHKGTAVDVVYWRKDPDVAKALISVSALSKYKKIPTGSITINNLLVVLEGKVHEDSINDYLNSINYEWLSSQKAVYENSRLNQSVTYSEDTVTYLELQPVVDFINGENKKTGFSFENDLIEKGYSKQASSGADGQKAEFFYDNDYLIRKEMRRDNASDGIRMKTYNIYLITKTNKK